MFGLPKSIFILTILFIGIVLVGCQSSVSNLQSPYSSSFYVDADIQGYMKELGKIGKLAGPAIENSFQIGNQIFQYYEGFLVVKTISHNKPAFAIYPLVRDMVAVDPPEAQEDQGGLYVNGYLVWDELASIYKTYGQEIIGKPLTSLWRNPKTGWYQQDFENMGFFRYPSDPPGKVGMLPYGALYCGGRCNSNVTIYVPLRIPPTPEESALKSAEDAIMILAERIGFDFTGRPVTTIYLNREGLFEKVFESLGILWNAQDQTYGFLHLPQILNRRVDALMSQQEIPGMVFFPIQDGLGHNIPMEFKTYISEHGAENFGLPISESYLDNGLMTQCFEHVCLEFDPNAPEGLLVHPISLGWEYSRQTLPESTLIETPQPTALPTTEPEKEEPVRVRVYERYGPLVSGTSQEIGVSVFQGTAPLPGKEFVVYINLPDHPLYQFMSPPTDARGQAWTVLAPIQAPHNTIIIYDLCTVGFVEPPFCVSDSFLVVEEGY